MREAVRVNISAPSARQSPSVPTRLSPPAPEPASPPLSSAIRNPHSAIGTPPRLLDQLRGEIRLRHYSLRTEQTYVDWVRRFILFHGKRHPRQMGTSEIRAFLSELAVRGNIAASTQNQALNALVFLYRHVLGIDLGDFGDFVRAKPSQKLPVVLTHGEASRLIDALRKPYRLMATLLYGAGLRLMEAARLRVKDIDFGYRQIMVRDG